MPSGFSTCYSTDAGIINNIKLYFSYSNWWEWLVTWGSFYNLSFTDTRDSVLDVWPQLEDTEISQLTDTPKNYTFPNITIKYLPNIGICKQVAEYDPLYLMKIEKTGPMSQDMDIFITDSRYSTYYKLDYDSHHGDAIRIPAGTNEMYAYTVEINQVIN